MLLVYLISLNFHLTYLYDVICVFVIQHVLQKLLNACDLYTLHIVINKYMIGFVIWEIYFYLALLKELTVYRHG